MAGGKYFTMTAEGAASYARKAVGAFGDQPYTLVRTQIPSRLLPQSLTVDRTVPSVLVPNNVLPRLTPEVMTYFPLPPH